MYFFYSKMTKHLTGKGSQNIHKNSNAATAEQSQQHITMEGLPHLIIK